MDNQFNQLLLKNLSQLFRKWEETKNKTRILPDYLIISVSDGTKKAKVITCNMPEKAFDDATLLKELLHTKLSWATKKFDKPLRWLRLEWTYNESLFTWQSFKESLTNYKRNYFRAGIAYRGSTKPWCLLTEMELNANACLYGGAKIPQAQVNENNLSLYIKSRHGSQNLLSFDSNADIVVFKTAGVFIDVEEGAFHLINTQPKNNGRRDLPPLSQNMMADIITKTTNYLSSQVLEGGRYEYGHFPVFGRTINAYNALRHASSTYALIEGYEFCHDNQLSESKRLELQKNIESALLYLTNQLIKHYPNDKAYVVESNDEIKLGANAVAILVLVKYYQVFEQSADREVYLNLAEKLANGIVAMQQEDGRFVHVLDAKTLKLKEAHRIIYYDGEAAFGLMRLYGVTKDSRWLACVMKAFDYFIGAGHNGAHDHWLSYCSNELVQYQPERKYFEFAVNNVKGYTDFIKKRITTFPTLLELSMAFHKMLIKLEEHPEFSDVLDGFDVKDFYEALHARANHLLNGFFFPETAMYFKKPQTIVNGCFIRHHSFRVRIDDVEHYLSGWVAYHELLKSQKRTISFQRRGREECEAILDKESIAQATNGQWINEPNGEWQANGLCTYLGNYQLGSLIALRNANKEKGFISKTTLASLINDKLDAVMTDDLESYKDITVPILLVENVRKAVLDLAKWVRQPYQGDVIGITGSAGKTTTVAMLAHVLKIEGIVGQSKSSANLPVGIAWNMVAMPQQGKNWVLEMAIGNMSLNTQLVKPNMAIITNIAPSHLEYHHTVENIAVKKARIFESMSQGELAVICRDIEQYDLIASKANKHELQIVNYGESLLSDIRLLSYENNKAQVSVKGNIYTFELEAKGKHMILNAMAVLAVADKKGLDINKVIQQLQSFKAVKGRGEVSTITYDNKPITVYDEAYNANPISMRASLEMFHEVGASYKNKLLILGDMLELGSNSHSYHLALEESINTDLCREIVLVGEMTKQLADVLSNKGIKTYHFEQVDNLMLVLSGIIQSGDHVLVKASNGIGLHKIFDKSVNHLL